MYIHRHVYMPVYILNQLCKLRYQKALSRTYFAESTIRLRGIKISKGSKLSQKSSYHVHYSSFICFS